MAKREEEIRIVMDTNVLVSAILSSHGKCALILNYVIEGFVINFISPEILYELENVLRRPKFARVLLPNDITNYVDLIKKVSRIVIPNIRVAICRDPDDDKFLEVAHDACAQIIVTGDPDLLGLRNNVGRDIQIVEKKIMILSSSEFLELLHKKRKTH